MKANPFSLDGKNIIITGASSGIGRQCAISCSEMGATIILIGRNEDKLKETLTQLPDGNHVYYISDITKYEEIEPVIKNSVDKVGKIAGFIHSAGVEKMIPLGMMTPSIYEDLFAVNVIAGFEFARIISKNKYCDSSSSLVFIASTMGFLGSSGMLAYCASKGALVNGIKSMALELAYKKIRVNSVSPGMVNSEMFQKILNSSSSEADDMSKDYPLGFGNTTDIANTCIYLLSDASRWVTGTNLVIDGGYSAK